MLNIIYTSVIEVFKVGVLHPFNNQGHNGTGPQHLPLVGD